MSSESLADRLVESAKKALRESDTDDSPYADEFVIDGDLESAVRIAAVAALRELNKAHNDEGGAREIWPFELDDLADEIEAR